MIQGRSYGLTEFGGYVWVAMYDQNRVVILDGVNDDTPVDSISLPTPHGVSVSGDRVTVSTYHNDTVCYLKVENGKIILEKTVNMNGMQPVAQCDTPSGMLFANYLQNKIQRENREVFTEINIPHYLSYHEGKIVACSRHVGVYIIDPADVKNHKIIKVAADPLSAKYIDDILYIADLSTSSIMKETGEKVYTIPGVMDFCKFKGKLYASTEGGANQVVSWRG